MNKKQEALHKIEELKEQLKQLEKIVNTPEKPHCLLYNPDEQDTRQEHSIYPDSIVGFKGYSYDLVSGKTDKVTTFQTRELADNYAKAFNTFLALRHCAGSEAAVGNKEQWFIRVDDSVRKLQVSYNTSMYYKVVELSPMFALRDYAQAAITTVGEENIIHMFKTFHHVE